MKKSVLLSILIFGVFGNLLLADDDFQELKIKRENTFEFAKEPVITKKDESFLIEFEAKSFCDVTISIEDENSNIIRHLACGVLGKNAPSSFQKNSLKQSIIWDGKDDKGEYLKELNALEVRVSLGLSPHFEKNLYTEPKRRQGHNAPIMQATADGVFVYDGGTGLDFVKLYSPKGEYIKTIYPFPGNKISEVKGLNMHTFSDGKALPIKPTFLQQTFLTSDNDWGYLSRKKYGIEEASSVFGTGHFGREGNASSLLAINNGKIALGSKYLFRFATDGTSGGMEVEGPVVALIAPNKKDAKKLGVAVAPRSGALSPDGKTLYLTAYHFCYYGVASADIVTDGDWHTFHCVLKMDISGDKKPELFMGNLDLDKSGNDNKSFFVPANVTVDKSGRVYVADYMNDRVQIYSPEGQFLKTIAIISPVQVCIQEKTQEVFVFSGKIHTDGRGMGIPRKIPFQTKLTIFEEFSKLTKKVEVELPKEYSNYGRNNGAIGFPLSATVSTDEKNTFVWLAKELTRVNQMELSESRTGEIDNNNIKIYLLDNNKLTEIDDFDKEVSGKKINVFPATHNRPRLYVNQKTDKLYVAEGRFAFEGKSFKNIHEIDPVSGTVTNIELPFDAEDMCFDQRGFVYLRTLNTIGRYDISATPWREVPFDYGMENNNVATSTTSQRRVGKLISALEVPAGGIWHQGGMYVNPNGQLAVTCITPYPENGTKFSAKIYPGRTMGGRGGNVAIHIYDKQAKLLHEDVLPGLGNNTYGIGLDNSNNIYAMTTGTRIYNGETYYNKLTGSIIKVKPNKAKIVSVDSDTIPVVLPKEQYPKEAFSFTDPTYGKAWVEGAEWLYGGVGYSGKNNGEGCSCWNATMAFDYFNRTFAPEIDRYSVAVLDESGNLIVRIGQYGNVDSQGEKSKVPLGGDEVGLMHGAYLATMTDKYLFISDPANQKIISVKLNYVKTVKLKILK